MSTTRLVYRGHVPAHPPASVFAWHERPGALQRLTPPWADVTVEHAEGGIRDGARVALRVRQGPASFLWELRHRDFQEGVQFRDEQVSGPLRSWVHTHRFLPAGDGGTTLEDEIEFEAPLGIPVGPLFVRGELDRLFAFRHRRLRMDLDRHAQFAGRPPLTVAVTGASGMVGSALCAYLTTGGQRVVRLVRGRAGAGPDEIAWDPRAGEIDADGLARADAVVHLAGASIAGGRWTDARKREILRSRVDGTALLARTMAASAGRGPRVLVSASAVGFYGNRGDERLDEAAPAGTGFLAEVVKAWEGATAPAAKAGVRVVHLRTGVVISPAGGALQQMLLPFKMGMGGRLGTGRQFFSWIDLDDLLGVILHALHDPGLSGPVNATAPNPVTNAAFTDALGRVLSRPTLLPVPAFALRAAFGQLGEEALLWGQRVNPARLERAGFRFAFEGVEDSLSFQLGKGGDAGRGSA